MAYRLTRMFEANRVPRLSSRAVLAPRASGCAFVAVARRSNTLHAIESGAVEMDTLDRRLREMRWLKNKVFFGSIASRALEGFR